MLATWKRSSADRKVRASSRASWVACAALLLTLNAAPSGAFTIDFVNAETILGEGGAIQFVFNDVDGSGVDVTVTARDLTGSDESGAPYPYLDGPLSGRPGGLGVCQQLSCEGQPDDNIGIGGGLGEVAILSFSAPVSITEVKFNNGDHRKDFDGSTGIHVGASNPVTAETFSDIFAAAAVLNPNLLGSRFSFVADESFVAGGLGVDHQLYIETLTFETIVPEPGTASLLGLALLGLALRPGKR